MAQRFTSIAEVMDDLERKAAPMKNNSDKPNTTELSGEGKCPDCKGTGWIFYKDKKGYEYGRECTCMERRKLGNRLKYALIPDEFKDARFDNYKRDTDTQKSLFDYISRYLKSFESIQGTERNSIGFIAKYGEQRIRSLPAHERTRAKAEHNNFGIGKTHLQIAAAKWLMKNATIEINGRKRGCKALCISDVSFLDELINAKRANDGGEELNKLLGNAIKADVLIWDDIGKAKPSEAKESLIYQIINERYRNRRPIIFSSNEDRGTLADRIGYAASSRLFGMAANYLLEAEGADYRMKGV